MATIHDAVREALEQAERGAAGGDAGQVITAQFAAWMDISRQMSTKIDELITTIANMRAGGGGADIRKFRLTKARGVGKVPSFSGNKSEFIDWTKRVEIFLGGAPELRKTLKDIKTEYWNEKVNDETLCKLQWHYGKQKGDVEWYSGQVHSVLMIFTGTPHSLVDISDDNGCEAWRKLH